MNISYHYYTIKTLAIKAGFPDREAQQIAYYSQMVDDFQLSNPVILKEQPPDFFLENGMAWQINNHEWAILPCGTGINFTKSLSKSYQEHTLVPFHFIPPKDLPTLRDKKKISRTDYRCVCAGERTDLLIHEIVNEAVQAVKATRSAKNLMALGMALHTYADTYAHCHFSGLHGFENEAILKKVYNRTEKEKDVPKAESDILRDLPPIGHAHVETAPDICFKHIQYQMKTVEIGSYNVNVERDNAVFFSACSREILNLLCQITGSPTWSDEKWEPLQEALIRAQAVKKDMEPYLNESYSEIFPEIIYLYDKKSEMDVELNVMASGMDICPQISDYETMDIVSQQEAVSKEELSDAFSLEGNLARARYKVHLKEADRSFFDYNELAYRRVKKVTGEFLVQERMLLLQDTFAGMSN